MVARLKRIDRPDSTLPADLLRLKKLATLLDSSVELPLVKWRVGLDPLLGLVPGVGDAMSALMGAALVGYAVKHRVPGRVVARMVANIVGDFAVGAIPIVGDVLDVFARSNLRNVELLLEHRDESLPPREVPSPFARRAVPVERNG